MAKKATKQKLLFKPTSIARLHHYKKPLPMVGDPPMGTNWAMRARLLYDHEMDRKRFDERGWKNATFYEALADNERIDRLVAQSYRDYPNAQDDNRLFDIAAAERDNAAWDYEHDNFIQEHNRLLGEMPSYEEMGIPA
jgi:hypothetical protein